MLEGKREYTMLLIVKHKSNTESNYEIIDNSSYDNPTAQLLQTRPEPVPG